MKNIFRLFPKRKTELRTVADLLEKVYNEKYESNGTFNIIQVRNNITDLQFIHSAFLKNVGLDYSGEFGFLLFIQFDNTTQQYHERFKTSKFNNMFSRLNLDSKYDAYYLDCKLDRKLIESISFEICDEIYDYNNQTKFEFQIIEY